MPRQLRINYPGAIYHVMSRGERAAFQTLRDNRSAGFHAKMINAMRASSQ